jgi:hypothetical protein
LKIPIYDCASDAALAVEAYLREVLSSTNSEEIIKRIGKSYEKAKKPFDPNKLHFSDMASDCPRLAVLRTTGKARSDPEPNGLFLAGHRDEATLIAALEIGHPDEFDYQFSPPNIPASTQAHCDAVWKSRRTIFEFKSVSINARKVDKFPLVKHQLQLAGYVHYMEELTGEKWFGLLVYTFRENPMEIDVYPLIEHYKGEMQMRIASATQNLKAKIEPPIPKHFNPGKYPCTWFQQGKVKKCDMWDYCWAAFKQIKPKPLTDFEAQRKVNHLAGLLEKRTEINQKVKEINAEISNTTSVLSPFFQKSEDAKLYSDAHGKNIKLIQKGGGKKYRYTQLVKKGLVTPKMLEMVEEPIPKTEYVRLVRANGEEENNEDE